ncbi:helix-turn-helix domain-containing protein [Streptomyces sp. NPDC059918]|uniref:helix-turn-helix domain-containing protein n=1 Tax=unclassified Streptomyces TaxID=2593676 RepID=UPI00364E4298
MDAEQKRELDPARDATALKALTHPLRTRLLGRLRMEGPATVSELAAAVCESSASTSYHLRVLAKYGFIVAAEARNAKERRWQAAHTMTVWKNETMAHSVAGTEFMKVIRRGQIEHLQRSLLRHEEDVNSGRLGPEWVESSGIVDTMPRLTPESAQALVEMFRQKAEELAIRDSRDPRAESVVIVYAQLPYADRGGDTKCKHAP